MKKKLLCLLLAAATVFAVGCDGAQKPSLTEIPEYSVVKPLEFDAWLGPKTSDEAAGIPFIIFSRVIST